MKNFGARIIAVTAIGAIMLPASVLAQEARDFEARDFADKLSASFESNLYFEIEFGSAVAEGNNIILSDWTIPGAKGSRGDQILASASVTFVDVEETADGGYTADQAIFNDVDFTDDGVRLEIRNMTASNIEIFADPDASILNSMMLYQGIQIGPVKVTIKEQEVFRIDSIVSTFVPNADLSEFDSNYSISGIYGDLSQIDDSDAQEAMEMFGLSEINASMQGDMAWTIESGLLSIKNSTFTIENVGQLAINLDILGYTLELAQSLQDQGKAVQGMDTASSEAELAGIQMLMSMASQLSLSAMSIRFDDDSVTNNLLEFMAADQGESRKGFISMIASILPQVLTPLGIPALQQQITDAAISFLTAPDNIEIKASPAEPVPFVALMAIMQNPSIANDLLNLSVTANQ